MEKNLEEAYRQWDEMRKDVPLMSTKLIGVEKIPENATTAAHQVQTNIGETFVRRGFDLLIKLAGLSQGSPRIHTLAERLMVQVENQTCWRCPFFKFEDSSNSKDTDHDRTKFGVSFRR